MVTYTRIALLTPFALLTIALQFPPTSATMVFAIACIPGAYWLFLLFIRESVNFLRA